MQWRKLLLPGWIGLASFTLSTVLTGAGGFDCSEISLSLLLLLLVDGADLPAWWLLVDDFSVAGDSLLADLTVALAGLRWPPLQGHSELEQ